MWNSHPRMPEPCFMICADLEGFPCTVLSLQPGLPVIPIFPPPFFTVCWQTASGSEGFCKPGLLEAQRGTMLGHVDAGPIAARTAQTEPWGGKRACVFHCLISHHSWQGELAHAELCATVGEMFLANQRYLGYVYTALQYRHSRV